jgi:tetratricopeptide (TPR) repeat protein
MFRSSLTIVFALFFSVAVVLISDRFLTVEHEALVSNESSRETLYLPSGEGLQVLSLGYRSALAHYLWFTTLNYFGKHYELDGEYKWLFHRCDLVTRLNPYLQHVYKFCSLMLAWEQKVPELSIKILSRAVEHFPDDWEFFYHRGFIYFFFLKDEERGRKDLIEAARLPGVPPGIASLATKKAIQDANRDMAVDILQEMLSSAKDPLVQEVIAKRLRQLEK